MNKQAKTLRANETMKEFYGTINDCCPICGNEIKEITGVVKLGNIAYHSECYFNSTNDSFIIK